MVAANAVDHKITMFVTGKSSKPPCFKNVKFLPCRYKSQQKSWMDEVLFEKWVCDLNQKFASRGRHILLVIDKCPTPSYIENMNSIINKHNQKLINIFKTQMLKFI